MKASSPLRFPGGKSTMASLLSNIRNLNNLGNHSITEPFAGGAGASITLLNLEETPEIFINDADRAIYEFWWSLINQPTLFTDKISRTRVSLAEWRRQRKVYRYQGRVSRLIRGFATFYLNRCNRSGIIMNGGPIGGVQQRGKWKINARFNKLELIRRCKMLAEYGERIHISGCDGIEFIGSQNEFSTFYFIDPPYFNKGKSLYLNALDKAYHIALGARLKTMTDAAWVLTYDDCPEIRQIYQGWALIRPFMLRYSLSKQQNGKEILIVPKWMRLPTSQSSASIIW